MVTVKIGYSQRQQYYSLPQLSNATTAMQQWCQAAAGKRCDAFCRLLVNYCCNWGETEISCIMSGAASSDYLVIASSAAVLTAASLLHLLLLLLLLVLLLLLLNHADQHSLFSDVGSDRHTDWTG